MYDILELNDKLVSELKEIARLMNLPNYDEFRKQELIYKILDQQALHPEESKNIRDALTAKSPAKNTKPEKIEKADKVEKPEKAETKSAPAPTEKVVAAKNNAEEDHPDRKSTRLNSSH